jgi:hypothetical protein
VTTVLLKVDWTYAMPVATFFLVFFLARIEGGAPEGVPGI